MTKQIISLPLIENRLWLEWTYRIEFVLCFSKGVGDYLNIFLGEIFKHAFTFMSKLNENRKEKCVRALCLLLLF